MKKAAPTKNLAENSRKLVNVGARVGERLKTASEKSGELETVIARACLEYGLDAFERAEFRLHRLGQTN